jgi:hypothetical protein
VTDLFGSYRSQTTRGLQQINSTKYPDTNKDFEKNIQRLNQFVDYISQYLQTMQKGVDEANQDPISKMRSTITDLAVLLGGGELLYGINLGDLQYYLPALGAMFGFDSAQPFPLNLLYAAEHFFLGYIVPLDSWAPAIEDIIDSWAIAFGIPADFVASLHDVLDALQSITSDYLGLFNALWGILTIFDTLPGVDQGPFADLWHAISTLLGGANLSSLGALADPIFHGLAPWIEELANLLSLFDQVLQAFTGGIVDITGIVNLGNMFTPYINLLSGFTTPAAAWTSVFTSALTAGVIPNIDASKIISGTFLQSLIPGLTSGWGKTIDASLILGAVTSAASVAVGGITGLATGIAGWLGSGGALPAAATATASQIVSGVLGSGLLPNFDASKVTTGTFLTSLIPNLNANIINAGTLLASVIPNIDASKVATGVLNLLQIPNMSTAKITSGTFLSSILPAFGLQQASGSNLVTDPGFENPAQWAYTLSAGVTLSTTRAYTGTQSMKFVGAQVAHLIVNDSGLPGLRTRPGEKIRIGAWFWNETANTGSGTWFALNAYTTQGGTFVANTVGNADLSALPKNQWNYVEQVITVPAGSFFVYPILWTVGAASTDVTYFDDVLVREETTANTALTTINDAANAAISAGAASLADAVAKTQQSIDQQIATLTGGTFVPGKSIAQLTAAINSNYAAWVNALKGTSVAAATGPDVSNAMQQQATQQAAQAALTASIQSQLPKFYGGSGTQGANFNVNFTSSTVLPAGWTDIACALCAKVAKYNTICTSDSETVSGIWSTADYMPRYLILRANAAFTTLVYAKIQSNDPVSGAGKCEIGCLNSGTKTVLDTFTLPGGLQANQAYTFSATSYTFTLTGPGGLSRTFIDGTTTHVSQLGALYRYGGFGNDGVIVSTQTLGTAGNFTTPAGFTTGDKINAAIFGGYGGGGGGGAGRTYGGSGGWGGIGGWGNAAAFSWVFGTDFPTSTTTFAFTPGGGGGGGAGATVQGATGGPGGGGGTTSLAITGLSGSPKTASGGGGGGGGVGGGYPGNGANGGNGSLGAAPYVAAGNGIWYTSPANAYGGPGSPGQGPVGTAGGNGGNGAGGYGVVDFISTHTIPGYMSNWVFYDSGPAAGPATAVVLTGETTTSASYVDLATTTDQVTVNIGPSGLAIVLIQAYCVQNTAGGTACVSFALSGVNTAAGDDTRMFASQFATQNGYTLNIGGVANLVPNLAPGATTFKMKYRTSGSGTATFYNRRISVIPL